MKNIAVFASGSGSNAQKLVEYFSTRNSAKVTLILSNKSDAFVIERAKQFSVPAIIFDRDDFYNNDRVLNILLEHKIDLIVLAGFLWLVPAQIIRKFPERIVNIHPALLPKFGGKGMYGMKVHKKVIENDEKESGISIHYVNEKYDEGDIIFRKTCEVRPDDSPESLARRIHELEYKYYPEVVENLIIQMQE